MSKKHSYGKPKLYKAPTLEERIERTEQFNDQLQRQHTRFINGVEKHFHVPANRFGN